MPPKRVKPEVDDECEMDAVDAVDATDSDVGDDVGDGEDVDSDGDHEEEDVFERFRDPTVKRKRKLVRRKRIAEKRQKIVNSGKLLASEVYNEKPSESECALWSRYSISPAPLSRGDLQRLLDSSCTVPYQRLENLEGLLCIVDFIRAADFCKAWLSDKLRSIGFTENMTMYNPLAVSHSTSEILSATAECFKMAIKQRLHMLPLDP